MRSLQAKTTLLTTLATFTAIFVATIISGVTIANLGHESAEQSLSLLCETGKNNVNYYFKSVEQSVKTVSGLIDANLDAIPESEFNAKYSAHMEQARAMFSEAAENTNGVLTYYYRPDPVISDATNELGFWYTNLDGNGFVDHEVSDLTDEDLDLLWYKIPKETGQSVWLDPYVTDNLDVYVISYNTPVYKNEEFIGVVGIEIGYNTIGNQISNIKVGKTGYAYIIDDENCHLVYHPEIDVNTANVPGGPQVPEEFVEAFKKGEHHVEYNYGGVKKHSYWMNLSNDMSIVVAVPLSEVNHIWLSLIWQIVGAALIIITVFVVITILYSRRITKPLKELTVAAKKINEGNYKVKLDYKHNDEIGILTTTVDKLIKHLDEYITDLNTLAYADALTSVRSKNSYDIVIEELQKYLETHFDAKFAIGIFDCDDLKTINDNHGHDKGDIYLRNSSHVICRSFEHSVVYRIGGDEFAVILQGEDYENRDKLLKNFFAKSKEISAFAKEDWEEIHVSAGIASYDPEVDKTVQDVMIHADHLMYENKRLRKKQGE